MRTIYRVSQKRSPWTFERVNIYKQHLANIVKVTYYMVIHHLGISSLPKMVVVAYTIFITTLLIDPSLKDKTNDALNLFLMFLSEMAVINVYEIQNRIMTGYATKLPETNCRFGFGVLWALKRCAAKYVLETSKTGQQPDPVPKHFFTSPKLIVCHII